jgi:leader peptidase (prepilin peptidase)/N-methyltransferase
MSNSVCPSLGVLVGGSVIVGFISAISLPWSVAVAATALGVLMIAGADIDARSYLLPDEITLGGFASGIFAAPAINPSEPLWCCVEAVARAAATALALAIVRWCYAKWRGREGLGFGDVKLAAAIGAWLPLPAIPVCFALATGSALLWVVFARLRGNAIYATMKLPFGAFICPALWVVFYATASSWYEI